MVGFDEVIGQGRGDLIAVENGLLRVHSHQVQRGRPRAYSFYLSGFELFCLIRYVVPRKIVLPFDVESPIQIDLQLINFINYLRHVILFEHT